MNLVENPWIPVVGTDGASRLASLADVFREGDRIADLSANPCQRIALMRLLICIAQAALDGPADEDEWRTCRSRIGEAALSYLAKWQSRFNLFGEGAFLQVDGLEQKPNSLADKLEFSLAAGNNPTLYDHEATKAGRVAVDGPLALRLLVYQAFSPGGLIGSVTWGDHVTLGTSEHAPCIEGSMLHTYLRGANLLESICWNLITREQLDLMMGVEWGAPCWEAETLSASNLMPMTKTYLGRLVPVSRCIRLVSNNPAITLAASIRYPKLPDFREPSATVRKIKRGKDEVLAYLPVNPSKHVWRELGAILAMQDADKKGGAISLLNLRLQQGGTFDIWAGGLAADKAKLVDMCEWNVTIPVEMIDSLALATYQQGVHIADTSSRSLYAAIKAYAEFMKSEAVWVQEAQRIFWADLDGQCDLLVQCSTGVQSVDDKWVAVVRTAMQQAYERTCPHGTPRQIEAYAQGWRLLEAWKGGPDRGSDD